MLEWNPRLIGFGCIFDQTITSAAIALKAKAMSAKALIAFGGYAIRPPAAECVLRAFPRSDVISAGEGLSGRWLPDRKVARLREKAILTDWLVESV